MEKFGKRLIKNEFSLVECEKEQTNEIEKKY